MMWEALVGGAVGGLLAGPWGMAAGAALGASLEVLRGKEIPPLQGSLSVRMGGDGALLELTLSEPIEDGLALITAWPANAPEGEARPLRAGVARFAGPDGQFQAAIPVHGDRIRAFLPYGVLEAGGAEEVVLSVRVYLTPQQSELDVLGEQQQAAPWPRQAYSAARFWRPLLGLSMAVAHADGLVHPAEVHAVRTRVAAGLGIPAEEAGQVEAILRSEPAAPLPDLLAELRLRAPRCQPSAILSALADVAHADGVVHPAEVAAIGEVARLLGVEGAEWHDAAARLGLGHPDPLPYYRALLGVHLDADAEEIERGYRGAVAPYAAEQIADLPGEMQDLARRQAEVLGQARAGLLRALPAATVDPSAGRRE